MLGQLGAFQGLNIHLIPVLATFSKISSRPKDIVKTLYAYENSKT